MREYNITDEYFLEAEEYIECGNYKEAKLVLEELLCIDPTYAKALSYMGWIYFRKLKNLDKAAELYRLALKYDEYFAGSYINYIYLLIERGDLLDVDEIANKAIGKLGTDKETIYNAWGLAKEIELKFDLAKEKYLIAMKLSLDDENYTTYKANYERAKTKMKRYCRVKVFGIM